MSNASFSYVLRLYSFSYRSNIILPGLHKGEYSQGQDQMESLPLYQFFIIRTFYFVSYLYYTSLIFFKSSSTSFFFLLCFLCVYWISSWSSHSFNCMNSFFFTPNISYLCFLLLNLSVTAWSRVWQETLFVLRVIKSMQSDRLSLGNGRCGADVLMPE